MCRDLESYRLLVEKMLSLVPDMVSIHDSNMNIIYSNWNGFAAVPEEKRILHTKCYKTYRGLDEICPDCQAVSVLKTKRAFQKEIQLPDGIWVDLRVIPILDDNSNVEVFVEWVRDITDRRQAEEKIVRQNNLLEGIINGIPDILAIQNPDHTIERYNQAGHKMLNMTKDEIKGKKCYELLGRDYECEECATAKALRTKKLEQIVKYIPEMGLYLDCRSNPVLDKDGNVIQIVEQLRDITKQKEQEKRLRKSERHYRQIVELLPIAIFGQSEEEIFFANTAAANLLNLVNPEALMGRSLTEFLLPEYKDLFIQKSSELKKKRDYNEKLMVKVTSMIDDVIDVELVLTPGIHQDKQAVHILAFDITRRKKTEEDILKANKLESISLLAGGIAHDFNNILAAVLGNVSLVMNDMVEEDKNFKRLKKAEKAIQHANELTRQLQTFARGGDPVKAIQSIEKLTQEVIPFVLSGSNVQCDFNFPDELSYVDIDAGQISQVMNNLVINALQAMPDGGTLNVSAENVCVGEAGNDSETLLKSGSYVRVMIQDSGVGIEKKNLHKIFDPFFTTKVEGSGLGLATSYSIVKKHGGCIKAESEPGEGTVFSIYLPASLEKAPVTEKEDAKIVKGSGRILVMDDEEAVRMVLGEILSFLGYQVDYAKDGVEAIERYKTSMALHTPYDLVILDLTVPGGMGGKQTIIALKNIDPKIKAVVSTGYSKELAASSYMDYGFKGFILKPYTIEQLSEVLNNI